MIETISNRQMEIIEAAGKILTASGVSGLTIKNLAREMQFSESAIYRHFDSKEDIIVALLEYLGENMDMRCHQVLSTDRPVEDSFIALFKNQFSFFKDNSHFVVAVFSDGLMEESQKINATIQKLMSIKMRHLMPLVIQGQQQGVFTHRITTEEILHITLGTFRLQMYKWRVAQFQFDIVKDGNNMIEALLTLIKNK